MLTTRFHNDKEIGIAYLYCNFRRSYEQRIDDLLASILKQLVEKQPSLPEPLNNLYDRYNTRRTRPPLDELLRVLQSVTALYSRMFIIVDALDECQANDRKALISRIFNLQTMCNINFFATSRFIPAIVENFRDSSSLEIRATKGDIERYLESHIEQLLSFDD